MVRTHDKNYRCHVRYDVSLMQDPQYVQSNNELAGPLITCPLNTGPLKTGPLYTALLSLGPLITRALKHTIILMC